LKLGANQKSTKTMDERENKFNSMKGQIRNFITHCLGFQPEDMTGGDFANDFTWKTNNSEFRIVAYYGCGWKKEPDYFDYYLTIDGKRTNGTYSFGTQLTCEDENAIAKIIQSFKETVVNKTTLNVTTNIEQAPYTKRYYIIQAFIDSHWQDVLFSHGDLSTAEKKARHYHNQNDCDTRVITVRESASFSYDYELVNGYSKVGS
jgi:hypothetical protein